MKITDKLLNLLDEVVSASAEAKQCQEVALKADALAMHAHANFGQARNREEKAVGLLLEYLKQGEAE